MTEFYDKRPILGTKGFGEGVQVRGVQELQEFGSSGAPDRQRWATVIPKDEVRFLLAIFYSSTA